MIQEGNHRLATLITPSGERFAIAPRQGNAVFTKDDLEHLIKGDCKAFLLKTGELLLVGSLACRAPHDEKNTIATCLLRHAPADPGGEVCGPALLLNPEEAVCLSSSAQETLLGHPTKDAPIILLLDRNDDVRSTIALGLERRHGRVIQARTAVEAIEFCRNHAINILVTDVSSLRPQPLEARRLIQEFQPQARLLFISGWDRLRVDDWYPGLLANAEFLQKPFSLAVMGSILQRMGISQKGQHTIEALNSG